MQYLPREALGHWGTISSRHKVSHAAKSEEEWDNDEDDDEPPSMNILLSDQVYADKALEDMDKVNMMCNVEDCSDMDKDVEDEQEEWGSDEDGDLGPEDGEVDDNVGYDNHYAPF